MVLWPCERDGPDVVARGLRAAMVIAGGREEKKPVRVRDGAT